MYFKSVSLQLNFIIHVIASEKLGGIIRLIALAYGKAAIEGNLNERASAVCEMLYPYQQQGRKVSLLWQSVHCTAEQWLCCKLFKKTSAYIAYLFLKNILVDGDVHICIFTNKTYTQIRHVYIWINIYTHMAENKYCLTILQDDSQNEKT